MIPIYIVLLQKLKDCNMQEENMASSSATMTSESPRENVCSSATATPESPRKIKLKRKVKTLQQKLRRRDEKISTMKDLIKQLKKRGHITDEVKDILGNYFEGFPLEVLRNELHNKGVEKQGSRYSDAIKNFATTLYFYSPRGYKFARTKLKLPHPNRITGYLSKFKCEPGFISEVFQFLRMQSFEKPWLKDCSLIIDSMSIRKQVQWDVARSQFSGYVEMAGLVDESETLATEALVFLIVSLKHNFKCPVGYFFIDKVSSNIQAELITICLSMLFEVGVKVWSITCDGLYANMRTLKELGCEFSGDSMKNHFVHPSMGKVRVILDPCHMTKLARGCLAEKCNLSSDSGSIQWSYIRKLNDVQEEEGMKFANKLSGAHINWKNQKMNVRLAAQTLSSGVADAIEFLRESGHDSFHGSEATVEFVRQMDRIFDMLNSRNPFSKGFKKPLSLENSEYWNKAFYESQVYLRSLKLEGIPLLYHPRKMFALGYLISIQSVLEIADELLNRSQEPFKYLMTYKFSQDHLELYFSCIRSRGGWNNNPNTLQFKWALRKLLFRNSITAEGNCINLEPPVSNSVLEFRSQMRSDGFGVSETSADTADDESVELVLLLQSVSLTEYQDNILCYIAGYLVRKLLCKLHCKHCQAMLVNKRKPYFLDHGYAKMNLSEKFRKFMLCVSRGGLIDPSDDVFQIVNCTEKAFQFHIIQRNMMNVKNINNIIMHSVTVSLVNSNKCPFASSHPITEEFGCEEAHEVQIMKRVTEMYLNIRLKSFGKTHTLKFAKGNNTSIRSKLTKQILFSHV